MPQQTPTYPIARELAAVLGGRKSPRGWVARCPAHDDREPSLSIVDGRNGRPIFHCFAGCDWRDVLDALAAKGLWPRFERGRP
jgi:hypothetical protein